MFAKVIGEVSADERHFARLLSHASATAASLAVSRAKGIPFGKVVDVHLDYKWFDLIDAGEKDREFRAATSHCRKVFVEETPRVARFSAPT